MGFSVSGKRNKIILKGLPWFMLIPDFGIMITSPTIPKSISDTKKIIYSEVPIVGKNYKQKLAVRGENRILSFTLPIINRMSSMGNQNYLAPFELLRNADNPDLLSLVSSTSAQLFKGCPRVIYSWGTNSMPLEYFVNSCTFEHDTTLTNQTGHSQFTNVSLELELNENSALYKAERIARVIKARAGITESLRNKFSGGRPY